MGLWFPTTQGLATAPDQIWAYWNQAAPSLLNTLSLQILIGLVVTYCIGRAIYNLYFHPLSKYPGPKLAAVTNLWWVYSSTSGKYPWIIKNVIRKYGPIVRIAPNELVFLTPQAAKDIYLAQEKNMELFTLVGYDALDTGDGGISGETNPKRHREIAKKLSPAFSTRNLRAKETIIHKYIDFFVQRMAEHGTSEKGVDMDRWSNWLAIDLSAALTHGEDLGNMENMQDSIALKGALKLNLLLTMSQITRKLPMLKPLMYLCIPPSIILLMPKVLKMQSEMIQRRLSRRDDTTKHLDYLEQIVPSNSGDPKSSSPAQASSYTKAELLHIENIATQLLLAGWMPITDQIYSLTLFLLREPEAYHRLTTEIRTAFAKYDDITISSADHNHCQYLHACVQEALRLHPQTSDGLPRISPGAIIDGNPIPAGVICQISYFAASRDARYFTDGDKFRPERWLRADHALYNARYKDDDLKAAKPFSQGPRGCPGGPIATAVIRLFIAKVLWRFDLHLGAGAGSGTRMPDFDRDYRFLTFWEKPEFWVRFEDRMSK
ncbi:Cytochrome P450 [Rhypophila decipiens]